MPIIKVGTIWADTSKNNELYILSCVSSEYSNYESSLLGQPVIYHQVAMISLKTGEIVSKQPCTVNDKYNISPEEFRIIVNGADTFGMAVYGNGSFFIKWIPILPISNENDGNYRVRLLSVDNNNREIPTVDVNNGNENQNENNDSQLHNVVVIPRQRRHN